MIIELRNIEIKGNPTSEKAEQSVVCLSYADHADEGEAKEWLRVQVISNADCGRVLAEVELDALRKLQKTINERIDQLRSLEGRRS